VFPDGRDRFDTAIELAPFSGGQAWSEGQTWQLFGRVKRCGNRLSGSIKFGNRKRLLVKERNGKLGDTGIVTPEFIFQPSGSKMTFCAIDAFIVSSTLGFSGSLENT